MMTTLRARLLSALSLLLGVAIYLVYRSPQLAWGGVVRTLGFDDELHTFRLWAQAHYWPGEFVRFSLPDGCWSLSYILLVHSIIGGSSSRRTCLLCASFIPAVGVGSELLQAFGLLQGVFDPLDLLCYALPYLLYSILILFP